MSKLKTQNLNLGRIGFTLVELLVVIAIIAILFAVVLVAINPAQRFKDSRNARRLSDVGSIVGAATTYVADRRGSQLPDVPDYQCIGAKAAQDFQISAPTDSTAFWRFDNSLNDAVPVDNLLTSSSTTYTTNNSGKFGEAIQLNGAGSYLYAFDAVDLDPTGSSLSFEGWVKLNQKIEAGSFDHHQALFDKGSYRLRLNSDSGKLEFDVQGNTSSWNFTNEYTSAAIDSIKGINTITEFQDNLYAGALTNDGSSEGRILKQNSGTWSVVFDYSGAAGGVNALNVYNGKLYSGHSQKNPGDLAAVYVFDGINWQNTNLGAQAGAADVLSLTRYKGKLYAGLGNTSGASIWEYDGNSWRISKQFSSADAVAVYSFAVFQGKLYAGTGGGSGLNPSHIFEFDGNIWNSSSVADFIKDGVYSLAVYKSDLYIGLGGTSANDGEVWKWTGSGLATITENNSSKYKIKTMALGVLNSTLYAGSSDLSDDSQVIVWNPLIPSWETVNGISDTNTDEVRFLGNYYGKLYAAGRGNTTGEAAVVTRGTNGFIKSQKSIWYPNIWYHIVGVYDGSSNKMSISINGYTNTVVTSSNIPLSPTNGTTQLYIGSGFSSDAFFGILDNFSVYNNTSLSTTDIASHAGCYNLAQYLVSEYMGALPIDPSSSIIDGSDTGYFISKDPGGVVTITAPFTETSSSIPEIIKASR